jgi:Chaperone of endosialidase
MKTKVRNSISGLLFIPLLLACFALLPRAQAETPAEGVTPQVALPGFNTADGFHALDSITSGIFNSAFGAFALEDDTSGSHNTALGGQALRNNTLGSYNTAVGENALVKNVDGNFNMALGQGALANNLTGDSNTAMGFQALNVNTVDGNVAVGFQALRTNTTGSGNTATGTQALFSNAGGIDNTAVGNVALGLNAAGNANTAIGSSALVSATGSNNIAVGAGAGGSVTGGSNNIDIGNIGAAESATIRIGVNSGAGSQTACFIAGIRGVSIGGGQAVLVSATGQLGSVASSSARFKEEIKPMDKASEAILALKPVTFRYKQDVDPTGTPQFGLIAEDVEKVNPDLVGRDLKGELNTVRYEAVNAMLLNEFLKEHRRVEELKNDFQATVARQQKEIQALTAQLKEQAAQIQKVSAQIEMSRPAPQIAVSDQ